MLSRNNKRSTCLGIQYPERCSDKFVVQPERLTF